MKKLMILALLFCVIVVFTACADSNEQPSESSSKSSGSSPSGSQQSQSASQSSAPSIQAKQIISKEDAAKLLGEPLKEGIAEDQASVPGISSCFYPPEKANSKSYLLIAILQKSPSPSEAKPSGGQQSGGQQSGDQQSGAQQSGAQQSGAQQLSPKKVFEILKKVFSDPNMPVAGYIGDDKFIMSQGMSILSGEDYIYISAGNADPTKVQQILKQAAELAITNLKRVKGK